MAELNSKWRCGDITPKKAVVQLRKVVDERDLRIAGKKGYIALRSHIRKYLSSICREEGGPHRYFTSAVVSEVIALLNIDVIREEYADRDEQEYRKACQELDEATAAVRSFIATAAPPLHSCILPQTISDWVAQHSTMVHDSIFVEAENHRFTTHIIPKEEIMSLKQTTKLIETRIFINGVDASTLSDDTIFSAIGQAEHQIKELEMIENKPTKLGKKITKMYKAIEKVKAYVDGR